MAHAFQYIANFKRPQEAAQGSGRIYVSIFMAMAFVALFISPISAQVSALAEMAQNQYPLRTEQELAQQSVQQSLALLQQSFPGEAEEDAAPIARLDEVLAKSKLAKPQEASFGGKLVGLAVEEVGEKVSLFGFSLNGGSFHDALKYHLKQKFSFKGKVDLDVKKPNSFQLVYGFYGLLLLFSAVLLKKLMFR